MISVALLLWNIAPYFPANASYPFNREKVTFFLYLKLKKSFLGQKCIMNIISSVLVAIFSPFNFNYKQKRDFKGHGILLPKVV